MGEEEVKKGFPSLYGIYLPSSPSGSLGRGPNSDSLCVLVRKRGGYFCEAAMIHREKKQWFLKGKRKGSGRGTEGSTPPCHHV